MKKLNRKKYMNQGYDSSGRRNNQGYGSSGYRNNQDHGSSGCSSGFDYNCDFNSYSTMEGNYPNAQYNQQMQEQMNKQTFMMDYYDGCDIMMRTLMSLENLAKVHAEEEKDLSGKYAEYDEYNNLENKNFDGIRRQAIFEVNNLLKSFKYFYSKYKELPYPSKMNEKTVLGDLEFYKAKISDRNDKAIIQAMIDFIKTGKVNLIPKPPCPPPSQDPMTQSKMDNLVSKFVKGIYITGKNEDKVKECYENNKECIYYPKLNGKRGKSKKAKK